MTPLEQSLKLSEVHKKAGQILEALTEIETHRERTLKQIRRYQAGGNDKLLNQANANLVILNKKRLEAQHNYHKYVIHIGGMLG